MKVLKAIRIVDDHIRYISPTSVICFNYHALNFC